jgi:hypothetical protein
LYPDPHVLYGDRYGSAITWNRVPADMGPITKLTGTLSLFGPTEDVWIITVDDDIRYLPNTLALYADIIGLSMNQTPKQKQCAYGMSGLQVTAVGDVKECSILEGYASACYHRSMFPDKSWTSYLNKCFEFAPSIGSDDLIISNWLAMRSVRRLVVGTPQINCRLMWQSGCILEHGNGADALHNGAGTADNNVQRYHKVVNFLRSVRLLAPTLF